MPPLGSLDPELMACWQPRPKPAQQQRGGSLIEPRQNRAAYGSARQAIVDGLYSTSPIESSPNFLVYRMCNLPTFVC